MITTRRKVPQTAERLSLALAIVLVLFIWIVGFRTWQDFDRRNGQVEIAQKVISDTNALLSSLKDAETGQRGYLLSGEDRDLEPYRQALAAVPVLLENLSQLADGRRPDQAQRVEKLRLLVKEKLDELGTTIEVRRNQGSDAALSIVHAGRGNVVMDQIRAACAEIQSVANRRLTQLSNDARASATQFGLISSIGTAGLLILLSVAMAAILRGASRRERLIEALDESEAQARQSRDWLETTLNSIGDAVIRTDASGKVSMLNAVAQSLTGWTPAEAVGKPLEQVFVIRSAENDLEVENPIAKVLREGRTVGVANRTRLIAKDGREIPIDLSAAPIHDGDKVAGVVLVFRDISGRLKAEERMRLAVEAAPSAMVMVSRDGRIELVNSLTEKVFGYGREELLGQPVEILVPERYRAGHSAFRVSFLEEPMARPMGAGRDLFGLRKDGSEVPVEIGLNPISTSQGDFVLAAVVDISERKRAEESLLAANEALRRTSHLMEPVACFVLDLQDRIVHWNPGATELYGFSSEEALGKVSHALLKTGFSAPLEEILARLKTAGAWDGELLHTRRDGQHITVTSHWALHKDSTGQPVAILEVNLDITERKEAERRLAHLKEQLDQEVAGLQALHQLGTRLLQATGMSSLLNEILRAAEVITGTDMGTFQLIDESTGALHIESQHGFPAPFLDFFNQVQGDDPAVCGVALARRERVLVEDVEQSPIFAGTPALAIQRAAGVRAMQSTPIVSRAGDLIGVLSTHYRSPRQFSERDLRLLDLLARQAGDLIERARAEERLRKSNAALSRANEDLKQFAFAASHDLQEPLRMITSYSQLLVKGYRGELEDEAAVCIEYITEGTKRMRELLADLLAYTQLGGEKQETVAAVDLNEAFRTAAENCRSAIDETRAHVTSDPLPTVRGHQPHFVQLFQNLISNGLKYRSDRPPRIHISAERQNGLWRIAVQDNGIGIDPEYHQQIFGVFKRLHGKTIPGTGIGLAICQRVVDRYGGKIWVESQVNEGATFYFTLPAAEKGGAAHDG